MVKHIDITDEELKRKIKHKQIALGGNVKLKIYGTLHCKSGKRMKRKNRVFFISEEEAIQNNFRACKHCMKHRYQ